MNTSRRQFLLAAGMVGAMAKLWPQDVNGFQLPTPEQARIDQDLPSEATQGPWRGLRAVREKKVIDLPLPHLGNRDAGHDPVKHGSNALGRALR